MNVPVLPDYGHRSLAEVLPAILSALGVPGGAPALAFEPVRAAALLLVDGLGTELLREHAADAPFLASLPDAGPLTGVGLVTSLEGATAVPDGAHLGSVYLIRQSRL